MTSELERIKILEGKISHVISYVNKIADENEKLKLQIKELKADKKNYAEQAKKNEFLNESLKKFEEEREVIKEKVDTIIEQIDQLGI